MKKLLHRTLAAFLTTMMGLTIMLPYAVFNAAVGSYLCTYKSVTFDADNIYINGVLTLDGVPVDTNTAIALNENPVDSGIILLRGSNGSVSVVIPQIQLCCKNCSVQFLLSAEGTQISWQFPASMWIPDLYIGNGKKLSFSQSAAKDLVAVRVEQFEHGLVKDIDGTYYYIDGEMKSGAIAHSGDIVASRNGIYYFDPVTFKMCTGIVTYDGDSYYHSAAGLRQAGLIYIDGKLHYFSPKSVGKLTPFVQSVEIVDAALSVQMGEKIRVVAEILPENAENAAPAWSSSDETVAKVDAKGNITPIMPGTTVITVKTTKVGSLDIDRSDSVVLTVLAKPEVQITGAASLTLGKEGEYTVSVTGIRSDEPYTLSWVVIDPEGVQQSKPAAGTLKFSAEKPGIYTIQAIVVYAGKSYTQSITVKVEEELNHIIIMRLNSTKALLDGTDIAVDPSNKEVAPFTLFNKTMVPVRFVQQLGAVVKYENDREPVTVSYGNVKLTLEFDNPIMKKSVDGGEPFDISLPTAPTMVEGKTCVPVREVAEGLGFSVKYDSNSFVIVASTKELTPAKLVEKIEIGKTMPTVIESVRSISVAPTSYSISVGGRVQIARTGITLTPANVGCNKLVYSSSDLKVATVTSNGLIIAQGKGTAVVTISSHNGKTVKVIVTVI